MTATLAKWYEERGRHQIYAGNKNVPLESAAALAAAEPGGRGRRRADRPRRGGHRQDGPRGEAGGPREGEGRHARRRRPRRADGEALPAAHPAEQPSEPLIQIKGLKRDGRSAGRDRSSAENVSGLTSVVGADATSVGSDADESACARLVDDCVVVQLTLESDRCVSSDPSASVPTAQRQFRPLERRGPTLHRQFRLVYTIAMQDLVRQLLSELGEDPSREGLAQTPRRVEDSLKFLTSGYQADVDKVLNNALFTVDYSEMVIVKDIDFFSMCEHHLLPFFGKCHVAYIPSTQVIGLSKIPRLVDVFSRRLQVQERLTNQIAQTIAEKIEPLGVAVVMEATHLCMAMRGVEKQRSLRRHERHAGRVPQQLADADGVPRTDQPARGDRRATCRSPTSTRSRSDRHEAGAADAGGGPARGRPGRRPDEHGEAAGREEAAPSRAPPSRRPSRPPSRRRCRRASPSPPRSPARTCSAPASAAASQFCDVADRPQPRRGRSSSSCRRTRACSRSPSTCTTATRTRKTW